MFSTDDLFFLFLFIVPGAVYLIYNRYVRLTPTVEKDNTLRIAGALLFSAVVFFLNTCFIGTDLHRFTGQTTVFEDVPLLLKITAINIGASFLFALLWSALGRRVATFCTNCVNKVAGKSQVAEHEHLLDCVFETRDLIQDLVDEVVSVEKDGMITYGNIYMYSASITGNPEFVIVNSAEIEAYFIQDAMTEENEDKIFFRKKYVYLDADTGLRITFYDTAKYKAELRKRKLLDS